MKLFVKKEEEEENKKLLLSVVSASSTFGYEFLRFYLLKRKQAMQFLTQQCKVEKRATREQQLIKERF